MDEKKPLNHREMIAMEMMYALHAKTEQMDCMKERMRALKVWSKYRFATKLLENTVRALLDSLPDRNKRHMEDVRTKYMVEIRPKPIIGSCSSDHIVSTKDLQMLCDCAIRDRCSVCMKSGKEIKRCSLRALCMDIAPPDEISDGMFCEYSGLKPMDEED